jgi:hypothetical protein
MIKFCPSCDRSFRPERWDDEPDDTCPFCGAACDAGLYYLNAYQELEPEPEPNDDA